MRATGILIFLLGSLPLILRFPFLGPVMWFVVSFMNIQKEAWGALADAPVGLAVAGAMLLGMVISSEKKKLPLEPIVVLIIIFAIWITITTVFSLRPDLSWPDWNRTIKMLLIMLVTIPLINNTQRLHGVIWAIVICIGIYGIRGGLFTLITGGGGRVEGPPGTMIADNNELATALIMVLPLMRYLHLQSQNRIVRFGLVAAMVITTGSIFGSFSRGALIGIVAMFIWMVRASRHRFAIFAMAVLGSVLFVSVMPQSWFDRMGTISKSSTDGSVMGRFDSYEFAYRQALDRPLGGGFHIYADSAHFMDLVPTAELARAVHSIYFMVLGEHGFVGLAIFVALLIATFLKASKLRGMTSGHPDQNWAFDLASMVQVSLIGYAVAGAFLPMAYFDLYYAIASLLVIEGCVLECMAREPVPSDEEASKNQGAGTRRIYPAYTPQG